MVREVRRNFKWNDSLTNPGSITAVKLEASYPPNTEVKLIIGHKGSDSVKFTASIDMDLDAIVAKALVESDQDIEKVRELPQYFSKSNYINGSQLHDPRVYF